MAIFDETEAGMANRLDWRILREGAISLYFDVDVLEDACIWFGEQHYHLYRFDATKWKTPDGFFDDIRDSLHLPDYCGGNLDSLRDCLRNITVPDEGGVVLVFSKFDAFWQRWRVFSFEVLDILEEQSRKFLLFGRRFIILIQSDRSNLSFRPVGGHAVKVNPKEALRQMKKSRGNEQ